MEKFSKFSVLSNFPQLFSAETQSLLEVQKYMPFCLKPNYEIEKKLHIIYW